MVSGVALMPICMLRPVRQRRSAGNSAASVWAAGPGARNRCVAEAALDLVNGEAGGVFSWVVRGCVAALLSDPVFFGLTAWIVLAASVFGPGDLLGLFAIALIGRRS